VKEQPSFDVESESAFNRRAFLRKLFAILPAPFLLAAVGKGATSDVVPRLATPQLPPTPACADDDDLTPPQVEGPFFTPDSPQRTSLLEPGLPGRRLTLSGYVLSTTCQPVAGALLDFWQADDDGVYDNVGYRLRGHQFTDEAGRYALETIVPGLYPGRTRHIHVKAQARNQPVLTTQLYFPDEARNEADTFFDPALLMTVHPTELGGVARFDFVLDLG